MRWYRGILFGLFAAVAAVAQNAPFTFDNFLDSTNLTTQYAGATFANAIILTQGVTLNEFEFPPNSGTNVASDTGGPISISFLSPLHSFSGYFTYSVPLTVQALDSSNALLASSTSEFSNNQKLSGASGSHPNELLQVSAATGIFKIVITGSPQGASFTLDDATVITPCDLNQDGYTNVADIQGAINQALGSGAPNNDLTGDGRVTIVDVQIVTNAALAEGCWAK